MIKRILVQHYSNPRSALANLTSNLSEARDLISNGSMREFRDEWPEIGFWVLGVASSFEEERVAKAVDENSFDGVAQVLSYLAGNRLDLLN